MRRDPLVRTVTVLAVLAAIYVTGKSAAATQGEVVATMVLACAFATAFAAGTFGLMLAFIAVLFTRPGDMFPLLEEFGVARVLAGSALLSLAANKLLMRDTSIARSPYHTWMAALTVGVVVSVAHSTDRFDSLIFFNNVYIKILLLWFLMFETITTRRRTVTFQVVIALMTSVIAAYSIWARFSGATLVEGTRSAFVGLLADPNDLALTLLMAVPFLMEASLGHGKRTSRLVWTLLLLLNIAGIVFTQSRGGFLGLGAAAFVVLRSRVRSTVVVGGFLVVALIGLMLLSGVAQRQTVVAHNGGIDASAQGRLDAWYAGARMVQANPITGVGLFQVTANYPYYAVDPIDWRPKTSHNAFVQAAAETGLLGFVPLMGLVLLAFRSNLRLLLEPPPGATPLQRALLRSHLATLGGVMVAAFFLSAAWSWFFYIVIAQAGTSHRVWITMPEVLSRAAEPEREPLAP